MTNAETTNVQIRVVNKSGHSLPQYMTEGAAGMDLRARLRDILTIYPMERVLIPTGLFVEIPPGYEGQVRPRSGLAAQKGLTVLNAPGTIDSDYRGEIKVLLINLSSEPQYIRDGDRIAQLVIAPVVRAQWRPVDTLSDTSRGEGGYGHTGER